MNKKIYVGGLPYSVSDEELTNLFQSHGVVETANVVKDRDTFNSRGFGFVEMSTQEEAEKAIQALNGTDLQGRTLTVNVARPKSNNRGDNGGYNRDRY